MSMILIDANRLKNHYAWWKGGTREMTMDEAKADFDVIIDVQPTIAPIDVIRGYIRTACLPDNITQLGEKFVSELDQYLSAK